MGISASKSLLSLWRGGEQGKGRVQAGQACMWGARVSLGLLLLVTKQVVEVGCPLRKTILVRLKTHE